MLAPALLRSLANDGGAELGQLVPVLDVGHDPLAHAPLGRLAQDGLVDLEPRPLGVEDEVGVGMLAEQGIVVVERLAAVGVEVPVDSAVAWATKP